MYLYAQQKASNLGVGGSSPSERTIYRVFPICGGTFKLTTQHPKTRSIIFKITKAIGTKRPAITKHLGQIVKDEELSENAVCSILERTAVDFHSVVMRPHAYYFDGFFRL